MVNMPGLCSMDILRIAFEGTHEDMVVLGAFWEIPQFRRGGLHKRNNMGPLLAVGKWASSVIIAPKY